MKKVLVFILLISRLHAQDVTIRPDSVDLYGTLTVPSICKSCPIALIIAGSGPTDRDGNNSMMKNNSLRMIADSLEKHGIASLRYDKRGIGKSKTTLKEDNMLFDHSVCDAGFWLDFLVKDKRFGSKYILGHSEGSLIGILAINKKVSKFVSIAGPGYPADQAIRKQLAKYPDTMQKVAGRMMDTLVMGGSILDVPIVFNSLFRKSVQPYMRSWFQHDPQKAIAGLQIPILILQGDKDLQTSIDDANQLFTSNSRSQKRIITNMNHVLKTVSEDTKDNMKAYNDPDRLLSEAFLRELIGFLKHQ